MNSIYESRFFTIDDNNASNFIFKLPSHWWSRGYEYEWAKNFCNSKDVVLDAACGICHPLKFYLSENCKEVHAVDLDERILSQEDILKDVCDVYSGVDSRNFTEKYLYNINYKKANLINLPYKDKMFDKIFCISVLEHLVDQNNKYQIISKIPLLRDIVRKDIYHSLKEFKRVLKDDGCIVLSFDYPNINLEYLEYVCMRIGLCFYGSKYNEIPHNALYSSENKLYCYRALLRKV